MGAYGRGFNLVDASNHGLYAPASSGIDPGMYTSARGFWGYNEFCEKMRTEQSQWTIVRVSGYKKKSKINQYHQVYLVT